MDEIEKNNGEIIIYRTEDGRTQLEVRLEDENVWLSQQQIANLFGVQRPAITKHLRNIFESGELVQSPNQKIPDRKTKCVIKTHINIKQNVIFGAKLKPV